MTNKRGLFLPLFIDQDLWRNRLHRRRLTLSSPGFITRIRCGETSLGSLPSAALTPVFGRGVAARGDFFIVNATDALHLAQIHLVCYTEDTKGLSREWSMMPPSRARSERDSASSPLLFMCPHALTISAAVDILEKNESCRANRPGALCRWIAFTHGRALFYVCRAYLHVPYDFSFLAFHASLWYSEGNKNILSTATSKHRRGGSSSG